MNNNIYLALDFHSYLEADQFLTQHDLGGVPVKVGMELFYKEGPDCIKRLRDKGHDVFLDLKLHDIPTTVYKAMKNIASLDVQMTNVHALGSKEMMIRAKEGLVEGSHAGDVPYLVAVTLLTSHDQHTVNQQLRMPDTIEATVTHLASLAKQGSADGVVCSVHEVSNIKAACGQDFLTVTPGIRIENTSLDDQKRVATPGLAKEKGSDYLVIGRSITESSDPKERYNQAIKEWSK
ncbi:orotidine-5'-phosphate decarboxylase [Streptohalobacillus salinus]|uniref:Orotidine 5'-phosphate decarboxylase n=1 Tax=Streptohalobacillus salinus TaxID=621096 RepID=A0A2V3WCV0_9BACI|nr:orotidine-5'-phosphate decarboxylase [Streptohalobacillus salinus]PXW92586.1 orotidine-5'-phosphate decarboxylase [Streptohalobacillus salinus]